MMPSALTQVGVRGGESSAGSKLDSPSAGTSSASMVSVRAANVAFADVRGNLVRGSVISPTLQMDRLGGEVCGVIAWRDTCHLFAPKSSHWPATAPTLWAPC